MTGENLNTPYTMKSSMRKIKRKFVSLQRRANNCKIAIVNVKAAIDAGKNGDLSYLKEDLKICKDRLAHYNKVMVHIRGIYIAKLQAELKIAKSA